MEKILKKSYYDPKNPRAFTANFSTPHASKKQLNKWLSSQLAYTLHKGVRRKFKRNRVRVYAVDEVWQMDLCDVHNISKYNGGVRYILTVIDLFTRYAFARSLRNKKGDVVLAAFLDILKRSGRQPQKLQSDAGTEFTNKTFQRELEKLGITYYITHSEMKASVVERFNRTLKEKMWRYFTYANTYKFTNVLNDLITGYNETPHSSLGGLPPSKIGQHNQLEIWRKYHKIIPQKVKYKYDLGDFVRISRQKGLYEKGYEINWTEEYFTIVRRIPRNPPVYKIADLHGEELKGVFYEPELQRIRPSDTYAVEKVLKKRGRKTFVKWRGWPASFNSWI